VSVSTLPLAPETTTVSGPGAYAAATTASPAPAAAPGTPVQFLLGTHQPHWLTTAEVPLFISDRRLRSYRTLPRARSPWALDSGAFTTLSLGHLFDPPKVYLARVRRYRDTIGHLLWAAPQDWMCEPFILAKTGLTLGEHQTRTVANYLQLREHAPDVPIVPVVQGWTTTDYLRCADLYLAAGIDLTAAPLVGVGSVCRRQATTDVHAILDCLHRAGITRLHGFGVKTLGLRRHGHLLTSADSMAWSAAARRQPPLPGCTGHINCANCPRYAYQWRQRVLGDIHARPTSVQSALFDLPPAPVT